MPQKIIYRSPSDAEKFDIHRYTACLNKYGDVTEEEAEKAIEAYGSYDPLHVSCLVTIGSNLIKDHEKAKQYFNEHQEWFDLTPNFERLRRITGYLVGSLERWNDGKKAEEKARVKHSVSGYDNVHGQFTLDQKDEMEATKLDYSIASQV